MIYKPINIAEPLDIKSLFCLYMQHFVEGYTFSGEIHDFWECVYVIDGEVCVSSDERMYYLGKGDIIFHRPLEFHKVWSRGDKKPRVFTMSFKWKKRCATLPRNKMPLC